MKIYYLILSDGRKVRIEANWNTMVLFKDLSGIDFDEFGELCLSKQVTERQLRQMVYSCALEGERLDGKALGLTEEEFGGFLTLQTMAQFINMFIAMTNPGETPDKKKAPGTEPTFLTRMKRRLRGSI